MHGVHLVLLALGELRSEFIKQLFEHSNYSRRLKLICVGLWRRRQEICLVVAHHAQERPHEGLCLRWQPAFLILQLKKNSTVASAIVVLLLEHDNSSFQGRDTLCVVSLLFLESCEILGTLLVLSLVIFAELHLGSIQLCNIASELFDLHLQCADVCGEEVDLLGFLRDLLLEGGGAGRALLAERCKYDLLLFHLLLAFCCHILQHLDHLPHAGGSGDCMGTSISCGSSSA
mmetsp:Transcript_144367/g.262537  ORF Transcript_144367/g.262537 Transcript_144367/m.262537 type:complete len:231 (-) Transcript_144367:144-836(-)